MLGGGLGNFAPGEWTGDTAMAWCILDVAATGDALRTDQALCADSRRHDARSGGSGWPESAVACGPDGRPTCRARVRPKACG